MDRIIFRIIYYFVLLVRRENVYSNLRMLFESQYWEPDDLKKYQIKKLNSILKHAGKNIPYYKSKFPEEITDISQIRRIEFLDKENLRESSDDLMWNGRRNQRLKTSGGSTGAPVTLLKDNVGMARELAAAWRGYSWAGIKIGDRQARFWGVPKLRSEKWRARLIDFVCHRHRIAAFDYDSDAFERAYRKLAKFRPDYFYGYVSIIREFAQFVEKTGKNLTIKAIITTSEVLTEADRDQFMRVFGCPVFDEYGCGEIGTIAHECEEGGFHLNSENVFVELVDELGKPVPDGHAGEIVVTDLTNFSMPLIRYRIKDWGVLDVEQCACGRGLPKIKKIYGRQYDNLENSRGKRFHGEFFLYIAEDARKDGFTIQGIQFIQDKSGCVQVNIVCPEYQFEDLSDFFCKRLKADFDHDCDYCINRVSFIEREKSGKLRVVKRLT